MADSGEEGKGHKVDTEVKLKKKSSKGQFELKLAPAKVKIEKKCNPEFINKDGTEGSFLGRVEHKVGKDSTDITAGFTYGLPKLAENAGLWLEGNLVTNNFKSVGGDLSAVLGLNNQYFIGGKVVGDITNQKLSEAHGFLAAYFENRIAYLSSNCLERKLRLGFSIPKFQVFDTFAAETEIELDDKYALKGTPISRVAYSYKVNSDSRLKVKLDISKDIFAHFSFIHKINNNLQISFTDYAKPLAFFSRKGDNSLYKLGISLEATL